MPGKGDLVVVRKNKFDRIDDETGIVFSCLTPSPLPGQSRMYTVLVNSRVEIVFEGEMDVLGEAALIRA